MYFFSHFSIFLKDSTTFVYEPEGLYLIKRFLLKIKDPLDHKKRSHKIFDKWWPKSMSRKGLSDR